MADMICTHCREPWDTVHVRNEAFEGDRYDGPDGMPPTVRALWEAWVALDPFSGSEAERAARDALGAAYYATGLGQGCTACWYEPDRVLSGDERLAAVEEALFSGCWDGDPIELLEGLL